MPANHQKSTRHIIQSFEAKALKNRPVIVKFADWLSSFFGTLAFLLINLALFTFWLLANSGKISSVPIFDPYPYVLLTTAVSLEAIFLTIIVLMSQNTENRINKMREELQLQVDLISEREISKLIKLLITLLKKQGVKIDDPEIEEMLKEVDTSYIEKRLEKQLLGDQKPLPKKVVEQVGKTLTPNK